MLNDTQRKFVEATLRGAGPKEAAIAAGLSPDTAGPAGARMRKHAKVVAALEAVGFATPGAPAAVRNAAPPPPVAAEVEPELDDLPATADSKEFLEAVQANPRIPLSRRMEAAKTLLPFQHAKIGEKGKKESQVEAAHEVAKGKFSAGKPPKLVSVNG